MNRIAKNYNATVRDVKKCINSIVKVHPYFDKKELVKIISNEMQLLDSYNTVIAENIYTTGNPETAKIVVEQAVQGYVNRLADFGIGISREQIYDAVNASLWWTGDINDTDFSQREIETIVRTITRKIRIPKTKTTVSLEAYRKQNF